MADVIAVPTGVPVVPLVMFVEVDVCVPSEAGTNPSTLPAPIG